MKFAPKVAVTLALVSILLNPMATSFALAADAPAISSQDMRQVINARIGRLEEAVKQALMGGRLTTEEADNYRSALAQVSEDEAQYVASAGQLGPVMLVRLQSVLGRIEKKLDTTQHDRRIAIFDFGTAEDQTRTAIQEARTENRLSADTANQLTSELKAIIDLQDTLRRDGILSYGDALIVSYRLDTLMERLGRSLVRPPSSIPSAEEIASATSVALSSGKLPTEQANAFRKQFDDLQQQLVSAKDIKVTNQREAQLLYLASQFELLKAKVDMAAAGKTLATAPKDRIQQIDFAIADAFSVGKLTPQEAHELRAELQGTIDEMGTDPNITPEKSARIALELERIAGQMQRWYHAPRKNWPGLDAFQAAFDQRIEDAAKANRLDPTHLSSYKTEAEKIAKLEADKRAAHGGKLETTDALDLAMQLERLSVSLHHDAKDRDLAPPDIDALQKELDRVIADGITSGKLAADGSLLIERLNHLAELRSNYEKSTSGLDPRARLAIAESVASTIATIQQEMHNDVPQNLPLDLRLDKLGDVVSDAVAGGVISIERGQQYRAGVDTIYAQLAADRKSDGGLTARESIAIGSDIDLLAAQIQDELRESAVFAPQVAEMITETRGLIGHAVANGRLTLNQANDLIADLDRKSAELNTAAGAQGGLSHGEGLKLAYDVKRIKSNFEMQLHDNAVPLADIGAEVALIDTKLANALAAGQLTVPEAQEYKHSLEQVIGEAVAFRESGGGLTMPETLALGLELNQLSRSIETGIRKETGGRTVDSREDALKKRIAQLVATGKLAQKEADALTFDLDRIEESEAAFRVSEEGLNYAEALTLTLDLDRLSTKIDTLQKGSVTTLQQPKSR